MCRPGVKLTLKRVRPEHAHAVDGDVRDPGLGILGPHEPHVEERAGIAAGADDGRDDLVEVEGGLDHHLLAGSLVARHHDRRDGPVERVDQVERQPFRGASEQERGPLPAGENAGHNRTCA